jgi:hypothetical protein
VRGREREREVERARERETVHGFICTVLIRVSGVVCVAARGEVICIFYR